MTFSFFLMRITFNWKNHHLVDTLRLIPPTTARHIVWGRYNAGARMTTGFSRVVSCITVPDSLRPPNGIR